RGQPPGRGGQLPARPRRQQVRRVQARGLADRGRPGRRDHHLRTARRRRLRPSGGAAMKRLLLRALVLTACATAKETPMSTSTMKSGYAPVNGLQLYYEIRGAGDPLLVLHAALAPTENLTHPPTSGAWGRRAR